MFAEIENENRAEENRSFLVQLSNVSHCMMYLHSGFPELYGPLLECLKVLFRYCIMSFGQLDIPQPK